MFVRTGVAGPQLSSTVRCPLRSHPCVLSNSKWYCLAALVLATLWYVQSCWHSVNWVGARDQAGNETWVGSSSGAVYVLRVNSPAGFNLRNVVPDELVWWFLFRKNPLIQGIAVPLWVFLLLLAVPTAILWHRHFSHHPSGLCATCGYPIGVSPTCTECGCPLSSDSAGSRGT